MDRIQSNEENLNAQSENSNEEAFVPKKAYQDVTQDMHKFKGKAKELEAKLHEYQAKLEAIENEKLAEQGKWQELAQINQEKLEAALRSSQEKELKFLDHNKKLAVISDLGGLKNDSYASFITVSNISVDENGIPNRDEVKAEADRIRATMPELLKSHVVGVLPADAPSVSNQGISKDYSQMSEAEKLRAKHELLLKRNQSK